MRRGSLVLAALVAVSGTVGLALSSANTPAPAAGELVFEENFAGGGLDTERWRTCHWWADEEDGCTIESNNELEWYLPEQAKVRRGHLQLVADRREVRGSDGRDYDYASGMISSGPGDSSAPGFAFQYGRAAIRARVPRGKGLWSAFWLLPADRASKPEIDVVEVLGHRERTAEMHFHYLNGEGEARQEGHEWSGLKPGWHEFAIDWRPGRLTWFVDGVQRWEVTGSHVPAEPMYLVANLAVGGDWPGSPSRATKFPARMSIDWVKVWK